MKRTFPLALAVALTAIVAVWVAGSAGAAPAISQVPKAGTGSPVSGATADGSNGPEFGEQEDEGEAPEFDGTISLSNGGTAPGAPTAGSQKAKSNPSFNNGFEGLNHYQQRYARGGNQFSRRAARPGHVRRQRLRRRGGQRRVQRLQHVGPVGAPGQHRDQHRQPVSRAT